MNFGVANRGDRGNPGERGPKGDHGQSGTDGRTGQTGVGGSDGAAGMTGPKGERGATARITGVFIVVMLYVSAWGWANEYHSCQRSEASRKVLRAAITQYGLDIKDSNGKVVVAPKMLTCFKPLPDH